MSWWVSACEDAVDGFCDGEGIGDIVYAGDRSPYCDGGMEILMFDFVEEREDVVDRESSEDIMV